jgi:glutathione peroxidase
MSGSVMQAEATTVHDFSATAIDGAIVPLRRFAGRVLLIVNVASRCGYTPQYAGLESLYRAHSPKGFDVLGFPCNQFGGQEPDDEPRILTFCTATYGVTFPMFAKVSVNGPDAHPLFVHLKSRRPGWMGFERIHWNFTKFLVDRRGVVIARFGPSVAPGRVEPAVVAALAAADA